MDDQTNSTSAIDALRSYLDEHLKHTETILSAETGDATGQTWTAWDVMASDNLCGDLDNILDLLPDVFAESTALTTELLRQATLIEEQAATIAGLRGEVAGQRDVARAAIARAAALGETCRQCLGSGDGDPGSTGPDACPPEPCSACMGIGLTPYGLADANTEVTRLTAALATVRDHVRPLLGAAAVVARWTSSDDDKSRDLHALADAVDDCVAFEVVPGMAAPVAAPTAGDDR